MKTVVKLEGEKVGTFIEQWIKFWRSYFVGGHPMLEDIGLFDSTDPLKRRRGFNNRATRIDQTWEQSAALDLCAAIQRYEAEAYGDQSVPSISAGINANRGRGGGCWMGQWTPGREVRWTYRMVRRKETIVVRFITGTGKPSRFIEQWFGQFLEADYGATGPGEEV